MAINDDIFVTLRSYSGSINDKLKAFWIAVGNGLFSGGGIPNTKAPGVIAQSAVAASVTGTLTETTLATIAIPAGAMGVNGVLRITTQWGLTNNANAKTLTWRIGGVTIGASNVASFASNRHQIEVRSRGAVNAQIIQGGNSAGGWGASTTANLSAAIDFSVAQNLTISAALGNSADTATLEGYTVEILNP